MTEKLSDEEFNASLRAKFQQNFPAIVNGQVQNSTPTGKSKSLEELVATNKVEIDEKKTLTEVIEEIVLLPVNLIEDSPYQPRINYDEGYIQSLAHMIKDRGQDDPVIVRKNSNGKFELIAGHRRLRAVKLNGDSLIKAKILSLSDQQAELATLVSNEGRVDLTDYEKALIYQTAEDRGFAKGQVGLARLFGCSQGRISQCLSLLKLPKDVRNILDDYPGLFGYRFAIVISELVKKYPDGLPTIVDGVKQLIDNDEFTSDDLKIFVDQRLSPRTRPEIVIPKVVANSHGDSIFTLKLKKNQIVIDIKDKTQDKDAVTEKMIEALRNLVQN